MTDKPKQKIVMPRSIFGKWLVALRSHPNKKLDLVSHLERHTYAPELNKLHLFTGDSIRVPGATTIEVARQQAQSQLLQFEAKFNQQFPQEAAA